MTTKDLFTQYFKDLHAVNQHGDAREGSFYGPLETMLTAVAEETGRKKCTCRVCTAHGRGPRSGT